MTESKVEIEKNFNTWCKRNLSPEFSNDIKTTLWKMYLYFYKRIEEKDNRIKKLEERVRYLENIRDE